MLRFEPFRHIKDTKLRKKLYNSLKNGLIFLNETTAEAKDGKMEVY